jgi:hypothetical protein
MLVMYQVRYFTVLNFLLVIIKARMFITWHIFFAQPELYPNMIHEILIANMQTYFAYLTFLRI